MNIITLTHRRTLNVPQCRQELVLTGYPLAPETTVVSFYLTGASSRSIDARDRLHLIPPGDMVLAGFDTSPLDMLLLWDIAHALRPGCRLFLTGSSRIAACLGRGLYAPFFREEGPQLLGVQSVSVFMKTAPLPAEAERGLDAWSFCIPVGSGESSTLNHCVARILSLGVPKFEILLCGEPHQDFRYRDKVRVVEVDIPSSPVHITRKKNVLAEAAQYPNLCILHDRILLPSNFMQAVRDFGDDYPFTAFQSFWFADTWLAVPRRYSDFCVVRQVPDSLCQSERLSRGSLPDFETMRFTMQHPVRSDWGRDYLTGSLYLCKKSVWQYIPQNEALYWGEYEDVEHGIRASMAGIPSRLNLFGLTVTLGYRSIFHHYGYATGAAADSRVVMQRSPAEWWGFPRRPHLSVSEAEGRRRLSTFAKKYTGDDRIVSGRSLTGWRRLAIAARLLWAAQGDTTDLVTDWYRYVLCESRVPAESEGLQALSDGASSPVHCKMSWLRHVSLLRQVYNNPFSVPYCRDEGGKLLAGRGRRLTGSLLSALWLKFGNRHSVFALSLFSLWQLIYRSAMLPEVPDESV